MNLFIRGRKRCKIIENEYMNLYNNITKEDSLYSKIDEFDYRFRRCKARIEHYYNRVNQDNIRFIFVNEVLVGYMPQYIECLSLFGEEF